MTTKKSTSVNKNPSTSKKTSSAKKKRAPKMRAESLATDEAVEGEFQTRPTDGDECILWRDGDVHKRIRAALAVWSNQSPDDITSATTLGQLAVGTGIPWNEGNQGRLVEATNEQSVFFPFASRMNPPPVLVPSTATVADWERAVWRLQTPHTFCFEFGG